MELERNSSRQKGEKTEAKAKISVSNGRLHSKNEEKTASTTIEVPSIRLSPEQIEEIHTDEYSLTLFYATRMEPLTILEMKRQFPEPEPKKVQSIMDRYIKVGLVHITSEGKYYSNYPENYINYSHYRYDSDLEARKDSKVFQIMKEQTGRSEFWKDKTYFSMDAFYSEEQSKELLEMFKAIKLKAKEYANSNAQKKVIKGLKFRRMKFFDMTFGILLSIFLGLGFSQTSYAGGNDPHMKAYFLSYVKELNAKFSGGGNDPTGAMRVISGTSYLAENCNNEDPNCGGGGHDPDEESGPVIGGGGHDPGDGSSTNPKPVSCILKIEGQLVLVRNPLICKLQLLINDLSRCQTEEECNAIVRQINCVASRLQPVVHE